MTCYQLESSLGYSVTKQNNIDLIEDDKLIFIVGNTIQILTIDNNENNYGKFNDNHIIIHGHSNGIGAFAIHPNKKYFAFGEIGNTPNIYIYSYPELKEQKILSNGTQRKYSDMEFNVNGNYLATIGGSPDHMLTIWDWQIGTVILRAKAFSQDVFNVRFSPYNQNRLITSGTGHIRFWEMAETFTGLKLQGKIGKFGEVDLSDVWSFVEFPSGKILSGSEHGNILMWHTDLIQFVAQPNENTTCHNGNIIYVDMYNENDNENTILISAGMDGCIKFWECNDIEFFEPCDNLPYYPLNIQHEIKVNTNCKLISMIKYENLYWIIQDAMGNLYKLYMNNNYTLNSVMQFHGLYVTSIECANKSHNMITSGKDGTIRHWNLKTQKCDFMKYLQSSINLLLPFKINNNTKYFMCFCDDGVVRIIEKDIRSFILKYSLRIHDQPIIYAAISNNSKYLATITHKQLFFSEIVVDNENIKIKPIGFVLLKHKLNKIYWSMNNNTLYSYCKQNIITYTRPTNDQFDTSSTFEIQLNPTITHFTPFLTEEDSKVEESKVNEINEEKEETKDENKTQTNEEDKKQEEPKKKENIFDSMEWEISCILPFYENNNDLLIAVKPSNNNNTSFCIPNYYQYNYITNKIITFNPTHFKHDYINNISYSLSKQFILISTEKSMLQISEINNLNNSTNIRIHSSMNTNINNLLSMSFDDHILISSSCDGSLFVHLFDPNKLKHPAFDENFEFNYIISSENHEKKENNNNKCESMIDMTVNDYSVQGEKIQREIDNAKSAADTYKSELRKELNIIRNKKQEILNKTKEFIKHDLGLTISDLDIDTNLRTKMKQQLEKDKEQVIGEMAWNREKIKIGLNKLENAFLKTVTIENIEVSSFRSNHKVSTFRTPILPEWVQRDINKVHKIINSESQKIKNENNINERRNNLSSISPISNKENENEEKKEIIIKKKERGNILSASKQKKIVRERLKNALEELQNSRPDENTDDPRDIEAINFATKNIGDYKLKSDSNYVVPENEHINASQKRKQMILLLESINYIKMGLNERVLALRDLKKRIIENITNDCKRLNEINKQLNPIGNNIIIKPPTINILKEWPEKRYNYTKKDLIEFSKLLQQELDDKSGNNNAFGGGVNKNIKNENESKNDNIIIDNKYNERLELINESELELAQFEIKKQKLEYERGILFEKMNSTMDTFDSAVIELREEKYKLQNDLKLTDLKFLTLLKELLVLSDFEDKEIELNGKLLKCRTDKAKVVVDLTETQEKLASKLEEIRLWQEKDVKIMKEFDAIVGERNQFSDELKKIFKRKIKRHAKKKMNDDDESDYDYSSDSSYDSSDSDCAGSNDNDNESDCDDSCPKDCDNLIYEKVMELREKRLDEEEVLIEFEKSVSELKLKNISLINREKNIDKNLSETEKEIQLFQTQKQQKINKIIITIPLLLSQIRFSDFCNNTNNYNNSLIFQVNELNNLKNRIIEQKNEKNKIKKDYIELKKLHKSLKKKIQIKQSNIDIEKRKCEQVQFLKYGRLVPLEVLDLNANINPQIQQLKIKLNKLKNISKEKLIKIDKNLKNTKQNLSKLIVKNTTNLKLLTNLKLTRNNLKNELNKILDIDCIKDSGPSDKKINHELQKLVQVAKTQANEIDVLKAEIHMLQRKGGMLYAVPEI